MTTPLPGQPHQPAGGQRPDAVREQAEKIAAAVDAVLADRPTSHRDGSPLPPGLIGDSPPVLQPDRRIVPAWAAGTAVAGIGVGAACVGVGCGVWLACRGFAAVTLQSVLFVTLPIAALAAVIAAAGTALRHIKPEPEVHHHYEGPVDQREVRSKSVGVWVKNNNQP